MLSLAGGLLGAAIAHLLFNGYAVSTLGGSSPRSRSSLPSRQVWSHWVSVWRWQRVYWRAGTAIRAAKLPVTAALRRLIIDNGEPFFKVIL
ncbi:MAG: hypothetical protein R3F04_04990 [Lysobacteraceae bacterium]